TSGGDRWTFRGSLDRSWDNGDPPTAGIDCPPPYYVAGYMGDGTPICEISPIVINLKNDSTDLHLTSAIDRVPFDLGGDGAREQVSWTAPGSAVAFLVLDRNGNGIIDDGSELFGTATRKRDGTFAANGFAALADLDGGSDGKIDASDPIYSQLRLWVDR